MHKLSQLLLDQITSGLSRKSVTTCSKWAEKYRVMGGKPPFAGPWRFENHPWLRGMHDSTARMNIGQKAAQMGYTETVLNKTFYKIDIERVDCLYVLPAASPDASDFSAARFDPALDLSPHLNMLFSDVKNVGHKRAGSTNLYIRGSKSRSGLKSVPVGFLVLDELNEMDEDNIPLALERQSGQIEKEAWAISTPTVDQRGINTYFNASTQEHFFFKCPHCSRATELIFPECLEVIGTDPNDPRVKDSHLKCKECKHKLDHNTKSEWLASGKWIPSFTDRDDRGFYINQMYSIAISPIELAKAYMKSLYNASDEQEFWNSKLGLPHVVDGAKITDAMINDCTTSSHMGPATRGGHPITMGVDVGRLIHFWIDEWKVPTTSFNDLNTDSKAKTLKAGTVRNFEDLDELMRDYQIMHCVIDANPERRKAFEFATRFQGYVTMCFYGRGVNGRSIQKPKEDTGEPTVTVDRTSWLDCSMGRIRSKGIELPADLPYIAKQHLKSLTRVYSKDADDNPIGRYEKKDNEEDHYAHARNYSEIALPFATGHAVVLDMDEDI